MKRLKHIKLLLFIAYCVFIVYYTVLTRRPKSTHRIEWRLLWSYREMLTGHPNWKKDVVQNINNILFFIPFGFLIPAKSWRPVVIAALCLSIAVETAQYFGGFGLAEVDDVICNTLGAVVGKQAWIWTTRIYRDLRGMNA